MHLSNDEQNQIKTYLDAVRARLKGPDREETLAGLESHIYAAIEARQGVGEQGNLVAAVLAEMDSPESYGSDGVGDKPAMSVLGLIGVIGLPFALPVMVHVLLMTPIGERSPLPEFFRSMIYKALFLPLGIILPIAAMALGWMGIQQARHHGGIDGQSLAAIAFITPPLMLFNMFLLIVFANLSVQIPAVGKPVLLIVIVVLLYANFVLIRRSVRHYVPVGVCA